MSLETLRLRLCKMQPSEAPHLFALNHDPEVLRYTGDPPFASVAEARHFLEGYGAYKKWGYGRLSCYLKESGEYLGWCGLNYRPAEAETDLGFRFQKKFWNQGYATEASEACLKYGFEVLGLPFIVGNVMKENTASIRVLEKLGMLFWKEKRTGAQTWLTYRITLAAYRALAQLR